MSWPRQSRGSRPAPTSSRSARCRASRHPSTRCSSAPRAACCLQTSRAMRCRRRGRTRARRSPLCSQLILPRRRRAPAPTTANSTARLANADRAKTHWSSIVPSRHSLLQPGLEERLLAGLGEFVDVLLHAGLDPTLAGWHLTAELSDVGFADLQDCPCARTHLLLRHRTRCGEQQDGTRHQYYL